MFFGEGRNLEDARGEKWRGGFLSTSRVPLARPVKLNRRRLLRWLIGAERILREKENAFSIA